MTGRPAAYRGRFAPSPTGTLHFGSLIAAVASYLDARAHDGEWLVRMDNLDTPRCPPGAAGHILATLAAFGFEWPTPVLYQSTRSDAYQAALDQLRGAGLAYPCACSRKEIADSAIAPAIDGGLAYPGTCRAGLPLGRHTRAWRFRTDEQPRRFTDRLQGERQQDLARDVGDFVLRRADGLFAYQLAVAVDDAAQGITDIVRGADLLDSTPRQIALQQALGFPTPRYAHLPVAANAAGEKLSKQTRATPLDPAHAAGQLCAALAFLGQPVPEGLARAPLAEVWAWARTYWSFASIPRQRILRAA